MGRALRTFRSRRPPLPCEPRLAQRAEGLIPAQAGISWRPTETCCPETPAFAGATNYLSPRDLLLLDQGLQLAGLEHLHHDVGAAEELAFDVELRHGRPVRIILDAGADLRILEHVDAFIFHAEMIEDRDGAARESALREERRALHEQDDVVILYNFVDAVADVGHAFFLTLERWWQA